MNQILRGWCFRIVMEVLARIPGVRKLVFFYPIWDQLEEQLPPWEERLLVRLGRRYREKRWLVLGRVHWVRYGYVVVSEKNEDALLCQYGNVLAMPVKKHGSFIACLSNESGDIFLRFPDDPGPRQGGGVLDTKEEADRVRAAQILGGME